MVFDVTVTHDAQKSIRTTPLALVTLEFLRQLPRLTFNKSNFENPPSGGHHAPVPGFSPITLRRFPSEEY